MYIVSCFFSSTSFAQLCSPIGSNLLSEFMTFILFPFWFCFLFLRKAKILNKQCLFFFCVSKIKEVHSWGQKDSRAFALQVAHPGQTMVRIPYGPPVPVRSGF